MNCRDPTDYFGMQFIDIASKTPPPEQNKYHVLPKTRNFANKIVTRPLAIES